MICPKWTWYWPFHLDEFFGTEFSPKIGQFVYVFQCVRCQRKVSR